MSKLQCNCAVQCTVQCPQCRRAPLQQGTAPRCSVPTVSHCEQSSISKDKHRVQPGQLFHRVLSCLPPQTDYWDAEVPFQFTRFLVFFKQEFFFFFSHLLFDSPLCSSPSLHTLHYTINTSLQPKTPAMQFPGGCPVPRGACQASLSGSAVCPVILLLYKENSFSFPRGEKKM